MVHAVSHLPARLAHTQEDAVKCLQILSIDRSAHTAQQNLTIILKLSFPFQEDKNNYVKIVMALEEKLFSPGSFSIPLMKSLQKMHIFCLATSLYRFDLNQ